MIATSRIAEARKLLDEARAEGKRVGFVPTMGALHEGHRSLIRQAAEQTDYVVVSIFINPTQFGPNEDLSAYPRTLSDDLEVCKAEGAALVFHPGVDEMYPRASKTRVVVDDITAPMEGVVRPGHFAGVALICAKLFNIVGTCAAFFGAKDAQQLRVVARMVEDLSMPVDIVSCPTVRDTDGLALSSRNAYLARSDRERSLALVRSLRRIADLVAGGERDVGALESAGRAVLDGYGLDGIDYLQVVDADSLEPIDRVEREALVCGAVRVGTTRLIDNLTIRSPEETS